tara:strand:- start:32 stop:322 length:291 start_codon:yes stop_codon:yes gene_type:complete
MVEKIINNVSSLDSRTSKNTAKSQVISEAVVNVDAIDNVSSSIKENKEVIGKLSSNAPIDLEKVSQIKKAISSGDYPLDLDKISDALMQAYHEMKS